VKRHLPENGILRGAVFLWHPRILGYLRRPTLPHDSPGHRRPNHEHRRHRRGGGRLRGAEEIGKFVAGVEPVHQRKDAFVLRVAGQGHLQVLFEREGRKRGDVPDGTGKGQLPRGVAHVGASVQHRDRGEGADPGGNRGSDGQGEFGQPRGVGFEVVHRTDAHDRRGQGHRPELFRRARVSGRRARHVPDRLQP
jgi:hypothetical protein